MGLFCRGGSRRSIPCPYPAVATSCKACSDTQEVTPRTSMSATGVLITVTAGRGHTVVATALVSGAW